MMTPSISVILPVYNGERYLRAAIESVLSQSHSDFELLVCDDMSSDGSWKLLQQFQDTRMRIIRHERNLGLFPTLNDLIGMAKGRFIRLWAQDDIMKSQCLATELEFHRRHPEVAMSYCAVDIIDEYGAVVRRARLDVTPEVFTSELVLEISFYHGCMEGNITTVMLKRATLDAVGLFREDMRICGDFEMWIRIACAGFSTGFVREPLIDLRCHRGQFSRKSGIGLDHMKEDNEIYSRIMEYLPPSIKPFTAGYHRFHRGILHFHYAVHALLARQFKDAARLLREVQKKYSLTQIAALYLVTGNRRFWKPAPRVSSANTVTQGRVISV